MIKNIVYCDKCEKKIGSCAKYYSMNQIIRQETLENGEFDEKTESETLISIGGEFCEECFINFLNELAKEIKDNKEEMKNGKL